MVVSIAGMPGLETLVGSLLFEWVWETLVGRLGQQVSPLVVPW